MGNAAWTEQTIVVVSIIINKKSSRYHLYSTARRSERSCQLGSEFLGGTLCTPFIYQLSHLLPLPYRDYSDYVHTSLHRLSHSIFNYQSERLVENAILLMHANATPLRRHQCDRLVKDGIVRPEEETRAGEVGEEEKERDRQGQG